jgi:hypothetical protein
MLDETNPCGLSSHVCVSAERDAGDGDDDDARGLSHTCIPFPGLYQDVSWQILLVEQPAMKLAPPSITNAASAIIPVIAIRSC